MKVECGDGLIETCLTSFLLQFQMQSLYYQLRIDTGTVRVRLFSIKTHKIYIGLLPYVDEFCRERGYDIVGINDIIGDKERQPKMRTSYKN